MAELVVEHAFQPIVEIDTGQVYGYEALMRGQDRLGLAAPIDLLDLAANAGDILQLEQMLHRRALAHFAQIERRGAKLFLNLDGRAVANDLTVIDHLMESLGRSGVAPSSVVIELTEQHDHMANPVFPAFMRRLKQNGLRVAIDDFGIGFSGLHLLCDYAFDYVKIDGHFVHGMSTNQRKRLLVTTMTDVAHTLGMRVVAEGIEDAVDYLGARKAGCDLAQGCFVAPPTTKTGALLHDYDHILSVRAMR